MAVDIETNESTQPIENGVSQPMDEIGDEDSKISPTMERLIIILNMIFNMLGNIGGPMLLRLYFLHGGTQNWTAGWVQSAGFPILLVPLAIQYWREGKPGVSFLAPTKLLISGGGMGIIIGLQGYIFSYSSSYVPVSTSQLLLSTQLVFTAVFAFIIVKQKFTSYSINAVVILTMGAVLLGLRKTDDQPMNVSKAHYSLGFFFTLAASAISGLMVPCTEYAFGASKKGATYSGMLQFVFVVGFTATVFCTIGMLIAKGFQGISREAREFDLGATNYYVTIVSAAIAWQMAIMGIYGLVCWTSALFVGVFGATLLPLVQIAGVIAFKEKFTGEKGMTLVMCIWGFTSYFYGEYKKSKKQMLTTTSIQAGHVDGVGA